MDFSRMLCGFGLEPSAIRRMECSPVSRTAMVYLCFLHTAEMGAQWFSHTMSRRAEARPRGVTAPQPESTELIRG
jgi:hypothetical protein